MTEAQFWHAKELLTKLNFQGREFKNDTGLRRDGSDEKSGSYREITKHLSWEHSYQGKDINKPLTSEIWKLKLHCE